MASLLGSLPAPRNADGSTPQSDSITQQGQQRPARQQGPSIPPYGRRKQMGWVPRNLADFGDGGAFPEIHVAQYPLDLGRKKKAGGGGSSSQRLAAETDAEGNMSYGAIVNQGQRKGVKVHSDAKALVPRALNARDDDLAKPSQEEIDKKIAETQAALQVNAETKIKSAKPIAQAMQNNRRDLRAPEYIRYTPSNQNAAHNSGASNRIIRMVEAPSDPFEPAKFKRKKVPRGAPSPPVPVMHSPPRKLTAQDQADWKIPAAISNWKNAKGFTIPLDKRLAADGRDLQEVTINDNFAKLSESLFIAERNAREEVEKRAEIIKMVAMKEKEKKEDQLRQLAQAARAERAGITDHSAAGAGGDDGSESESDGEAAARAEREEIRADRKRERERDYRLQAASQEKRQKIQSARDDGRDISEKIALGAQVKSSGGEAMYDQRLFNQSEGMSSGFGAEDDYSVYDKPLFGERASDALYRPKASADKANEDLVDSLIAERDGGDKKPQRGTSRSKPVAFEHERQDDGEKASGGDQSAAPVEEDPFGFDSFLGGKSGGERKANALDKVGQGSSMRAGGASGNKEDYEGRDGDRKINFESSKKR